MLIERASLNPVKVAMRLSSPLPEPFEALGERSLSVNPSASYPRPSPPFGMEEREAEVRERKSFGLGRSVRGLLARANLTRIRWLATVSLFSVMAVGAIAGSSNAVAKIVPAATSPAGEKSPWQRIVMIGASVTAGFTVSEPLGGPNTPYYDLGRYVEAALIVPHEPVRNLGNALFFLQPNLIAQQQMTRALTNNPSLVIGVDFLFWFCYGDGNTDQERLRRFDQGLKLLERVKCPLIVGDIPDASAAVNEMLRPDQMPSLKAIAAANARLKEWAKSRPQVVILGVAEFMRNVMANRAIKIHDYVLPEGKTRGLIQDDKLHSSPTGCAVLALAALDTFQSSRPGVRGSEFHSDPREIFRRATKSQRPSPAPSSQPKAVQQK